MGESLVHAVVLAAGKAERFGREKLTVEYQGRPLLAHVLQTIATAIKEGTLASGVVVLRPEARQIENLTREAGLIPVVNPKAEAGISESLRVGIAAVTAVDGTGAILVFPGDQPHVRLEVIIQLVQAWRTGSGPVIRPRYTADPDAPNHPVLLDSTVWPLVSQLSGDTGFASVFHRKPELVTTIDVSGRNPDVDTPRDVLPSLSEQ